MKTPEMFLNVASYAKEVLDAIKNDGGLECQETVEI